MSIDTELARLANAKAAIKAAIEGKGVTVPSGTLLDGMASLIEGIEAGGNERVSVGTTTLNTASASIRLMSRFEPDIWVLIGPVTGGGSNLVGLALSIKDDDGNIYQEKWRYQSTKYLIGTSSEDSSLFSLSFDPNGYINIYIKSGYSSYGEVWGAKTYKYFSIKK